MVIILEASRCSIFKISVFLALWIISIYIQSYANSNLHVSTLCIYIYIYIEV